MSETIPPTSDGVGQARGEWVTRSRALSLCKRHGHRYEPYWEPFGLLLECTRCGHHVAG